MCTLILGLDTAGRGSVIVAANRDEDPARPSAPPAVLRDEPRVAGGRDLLKGGTWLAVRGRRAAIARLNRKPDPALPGRRSRGLLALEVAAAGDGGPDAALRCAREAARPGEFAPFSLLYAAPDASWLLANDASGIRESRVGPGWHVITHAELDDANEPRTRWLMRRLATFGPASGEEAERGLMDLLRLHGGERAGGEPAPPVCLHAGPMRTVSAALVSLSRDRAHYLHVEGPPCTGTALDCTQLLDSGSPARADRT